MGEWTRERLAELIHQILRDDILSAADDFTTSSNLVEAGIDSLAVTQLMLSIEEATGVWVDESLLTPENLETRGDARGLCPRVHPCGVTARRSPARIASCGPSIPRPCAGTEPVISRSWCCGWDPASISIASGACSPSVVEANPILRAPIRRDFALGPPVLPSRPRCARALCRRSRSTRAETARCNLPALFRRRLNETRSGRRGELLRVDVVRHPRRPDRDRSRLHLAPHALRRSRQRAFRRVPGSLRHGNVWAWRCSRCRPARSGAGGPAPDRACASAARWRWHGRTG